MNKNFETQKAPKAFRTISEVAGELDLQPYVIRFWESQFKQIKPIIINKRRHYDDKNIDVLKKIKFLLKDKGMTISGAKKQLNVFSNPKLSWENVLAFLKHDKYLD